jgi:hypothetical protein
LTGTESLISQIEEDRSYYTKLAAAKELKQRLLMNRQIDRLLGFVDTDISPPIRIQIVDSLSLALAQRDSADLNRHVRNVLHEKIPVISDEDVCYAAYRFLMELTEDREEELEYALEFMQENRHPKVRYWSLRHIIDNGPAEEGALRDEVLFAIHRTLKNENNAAVAEMASRELGRQIYRPSLKTLEDISNSAEERKFLAAKYDNLEGRVTHADVIAASIRYAEGIRFATGDL